MNKEEERIETSEELQERENRIQVEKLD